MNIISYILKTIRQPNLQYVLEEVQMCFESSYYDMHLLQSLFPLFSKLAAKLHQRRRAMSCAKTATS